MTGIDIRLEVINIRLEVQLPQGNPALSPVSDFINQVTSITGNYYVFEGVDMPVQGTSMNILVTDGTSNDIQSVINLLPNLASQLNVSSLHYVQIPILKG